MTWLLGHMQLLGFIDFCVRSKLQFEWWTGLLELSVPPLPQCWTLAKLPFLQVYQDFVLRGLVNSACSWDVQLTLLSSAQVHAPVSHQTTLKKTQVKDKMTMNFKMAAAEHGTKHRTFWEWGPAPQHTLQMLTALPGSTPQHSAYGGCASRLRWAIEP